jgi:branched-chain amino acid transport system substrate-binding protein
MRKLCLFLLTVITALALPGTRLGAQDAIKIGEFSSLTGKEASFGQFSHNGTQLAIDEINARGGVLGKPIQLIYEDDQSKAGQAATVVRKLISSDKVVAILGEVASSRSLEAAPVCQASQIPMITPASTNPDVTEKGDLIFRTCFTDAFQGKLLAEFAAKSLKAKKVAVLIDTKSDYSVGLANNFKQAFLANGGEIVSERNYSGGDKDFRAQLTTIKAARPDAVFIPGYYTDVGLLIRQARQVGIRAALFGGDGWGSPSLPQVAGAAIEGTYYSTHFSADENRAEVQDFVAKYKAKYGVSPDAMAALGYDSALILADAIKRAGSTDAQKLRAAIASTKDFACVTGPISLDEHRNARKSAVMLKASSNDFKYMETIKP